MTPLSEADVTAWRQRVTQLNGRVTSMAPWPTHAGHIRLIGETNGLLSDLNGLRQDERDQIFADTDAEQALLSLAQSMTTWSSTATSHLSDEFKDKEAGKPK